MRTSLLPLLAAATLLVGCSSGSGSAPTTAADAAPASPAAPAPAPDGGLPADAAAEVTDWVDCPYLDTQWVADTNGQRMTKLGIDSRFATPACVFYSYQEAPQATVIVRDMGSEDQAHAAVDWAAPIDVTEPVSAADTNGWEGGRGVLGEDMSVYAVAKGTKAVLVWTSQQQTVKAELIANEAIARLGL